MSEPRSRLKLLSYNIQAGTTTGKYREYFTRSWRQVLPNNQRMANLDAIADLVGEYDLVGLQEVDVGSLRSGFVNQAKYLATHANFPFWRHQGNRKVGLIAHAGNGVLARHVPARVHAHRLPGAIPGRGALVVEFGEGDNALWVVVLHLALGRRARAQQLRYVAHLIDQHPHVVVMGDLNAEANSPEMLDFLGRANLMVPDRSILTFPSWRPQRAIDHILVSPGMEIESLEVLPATFSDHRPLAMELLLPPGLQRHARGDEQEDAAEDAAQHGRRQAMGQAGARGCGEDAA